MSAKLNLTLLGHGMRTVNTGRTLDATDRTNSFEQWANTAGNLRNRFALLLIDLPGLIKSLPENFRNKVKGVIAVSATTSMEV